MCPVQVDKQAKKDQIVRAALGLFSKKGYAASSVREIAGAAGMGKGTLYEYFSTKADIFLAAASHWIAQLEARVSTRLEEMKDPAQRLKTLAKAFVELVDPLDPMTARMSVEVIRHGVLQDGVLFNRRRELRERMGGTQRMVEQILLDGISKGVFKAEAAGHVGKIAVNLVGFLDGILLHSVMTERHFDLKEHVDFHLNSLILSISNVASGKAKA